MGLDMTKSLFGVSGKAGLKPVPSANIYIFEAIL